MKTVVGLIAISICLVSFHESVAEQPVVFFSWHSSEMTAEEIADKVSKFDIEEGWMFDGRSHPYRAKNKRYDLGDKQQIQVSNAQNVTLGMTSDGRIRTSLNLNREAKYAAGTESVFQSDQHTQFLIASNRSDGAMRGGKGANQQLMIGVDYRYEFDVTVVDTYPAGTYSADKWWKQTRWTIVHQLHGAFDQLDQHNGTPDVQPAFDICIYNVGKSAYWRLRSRYGYGDEAVDDFEHEQVRQLKSFSGYEVQSPSMGAKPEEDPRQQLFVPPPEGGSRTYTFKVEIRLCDGTANGRTKVTLIQDGTATVMMDRDGVENYFKKKPSDSSHGLPGPVALFGPYTYDNDPKDWWDPTTADLNANGVADHFESTDTVTVDRDQDGIKDALQLKPVNQYISYVNNPNLEWMDLEKGINIQGVSGEGLYFEQICLLFDNIEFAVVPRSPVDANAD